jgi:acetyltransferase-like isoleucine patch superfamily enzyme
MVGEAGATDPVTGELFGSLAARKAIDAGRASMGAHTYGPFTVHVGRGERARVHIGDFCSMARGVQFIVGGNQHPDWVSTYPFRVIWSLPGVWSDGHPRPGVTIGDGAVIGARALVAADARPDAIAVGIPAREQRRRFGDQQVDALLALRWWEAPEEKVHLHVDILSSPEIDALLEADG